MSDWTKVEKEREDWEKEDKTDFGWFMHGWFYDWFSRTLWRIINKVKEDFTKISKDTGDFTKVEKEREDWTKITKE